MKKIIISIIGSFIFLNCAQNTSEFQKLNLSNGKVERIENFDSKYITPRNVDIWLPDNYSEEKKYAVLYMHDGQMLFDSTSTWNQQEWGVDETMGNLLNKNEIRNTIVVGIWNTEFRYSEYFPQTPFENLPKIFQDSLLFSYKRDQESSLFKIKVVSDNYLKFITSELKPFIDSKYATHTNAGNTFIAGSSMGGLISIYALCEYPEVFSGVACLSTHWIGIFDTINNPIPNAFSKYLDKNLPDSKDHRIYFDFGTETLDAFYEPYQIKIDSLLIKHGYNDQNWKTLKFIGENHSEIAWNKRLEIPLSFLLGHKK